MWREGWGRGEGKKDGGVCTKKVSEWLCCLRRTTEGKARVAGDTSGRMSLQLDRESISRNAALQPQHATLKTRFQKELELKGCVCLPVAVSCIFSLFRFFFFPYKIYRGTHKVWLQHSRSLDHSDILLLTAMFTHPLLDIRPASPGLRPTAFCHAEGDRPNASTVCSDKCHLSHLGDSLSIIWWNDFRL